MNIEGGGTYTVTPAILQFLSYDEEEVYGHLSEEDKRLLISIQGGVQQHDDNPICLAEENPSSCIEFGCASEVFNSITSGQFNPRDPDTLPPSLCSTPSLLSFESVTGHFETGCIIQPDDQEDRVKSAEVGVLPQFGDVVINTFIKSSDEDVHNSNDQTLSTPQTPTPILMAATQVSYPDNNISNSISSQRQHKIHEPISTSELQNTIQTSQLYSELRNVPSKAEHQQLNEAEVSRQPGVRTPVIFPNNDGQQYSSTQPNIPMKNTSHINNDPKSQIRGYPSVEGAPESNYQNSVHPQIRDQHSTVPPQTKGIQANVPLPTASHPQIESSQIVNMPPPREYQNSAQQPSSYLQFGTVPVSGRPLPMDTSSGGYYPGGPALARATPPGIASPLPGIVPHLHGLTSAVPRIAPPLPGTPQHIHINHFTANLTYLPAMSGTASSPVQPVSTVGPAVPAGGLITRQPVPFASHPLNYVAPFPHFTSATPIYSTAPPIYSTAPPMYSTTPPMFSTAPFPPMVIYPPGHPVHFSMYAPSADAASGETQENINQQKNEDHSPAPPSDGSPKRPSLNKDNDSRPSSSSSMVVISESQSKESHSLEEPQPVESRPQEDHELTNLYESRRTKTKSESSNVTTTPRPYLEDSRVQVQVHRPTPPPFPITQDVYSNGQINEQSTDDGKPKSWASLLFSGSDPSAERIHVDKPTARIPPFSSLTSSTKLGAYQDLQVPWPQGLLQVGEYLKNYELDQAQATILPRGLTNRSNWCFVNAILQALLACPPFFNLFKGLINIDGFRHQPQVNFKTPMLEAIVRFVKEFKPLETMQKSNRKDRLRRREDVQVDVTFEPSYVYTVLMEAKTWQVDEDRQEDAEEFLSHLLNVLDEDMRGLIKLTQSAELVASQSSNPLPREWEEITTKGKTCITRRVVDQSTTTRTPIQALFSGITRSSVIAENCETSATLQPFFALQLDIQSPDVNNLQDVLVNNFTSELLEGYRNPRSGQLAPASKTLSLEELPPVLILHLKRMVYDGHTEQKVMKEIQFPVDLSISRDILSANCKTKYTLKQRAYKLFAVVYHKGREAIKGHYITDIYHTGYSCWIRCDDSQVTFATAEQVMTTIPHSTPYILFYRQMEEHRSSELQ